MHKAARDGTKRMLQRYSLSYGAFSGCMLSKRHLGHAQRAGNLFEKQTRLKLKKVEAQAL
jgi:hypothetical protein